MEDKLKTRNPSQWYCEYERDYKWYGVKKGGFRDSHYYFRTEALERVKELTEMDKILELNKGDII